MNATRQCTFCSGQAEPGPEHGVEAMRRCDVGPNSAAKHACEWGDGTVRPAAPALPPPTTVVVTRVGRGPVGCPLAAPSGQRLDPDLTAPVPSHPAPSLCRQYRHVYCEPPKHDEKFEGLRLATTTGEQQYIKVRTHTSQVPCWTHARDQHTNIPTYQPRARTSNCRRSLATPLARATTPPLTPTSASIMAG